MYNQCGCEKLEKWGDHWWNYVFAMAPRAGLYVRCFCAHTNTLSSGVCMRAATLSRIHRGPELYVYNLITGWHKSGSCYNRWRRGHNRDWPTSNPQGRRIVFFPGAIALTRNQKLRATEMQTPGFNQGLKNILTLFVTRNSVEIDNS